MVHELCGQHMMLYELLHTLWWLFCLFVFWHYLICGGCFVCLFFGIT